MSGKGRETKDMVVREGGNMPASGRFFVVATLCIKVALKSLYATLFGAVLLGTTASVGAQSQSGTASAPVFEYDVASIKLNKLGGASYGSHTTLDSYSITNVPLQALIQFAFGIQNYQVVGAPDWLASERYDIEAKMEPDVADALQKLSLDDRRDMRQRMLQALILDRLQMKIHHETRELPVFSLVIAKNGSKLQESKVDPANPSAPIGRGGPSVRTSRNGSGPITLTVLRCVGSDLAGVLATHVGRVVLDKTGLTAMYDFTLQFMPDDASIAPVASSGSSAADPTAPSIFTAVQEQLGLKLESGKGPVEVMVIDHVERPSGN
jgi:uncharacterized protein (TIGR03435 family)